MSRGPLTGIRVADFGHVWAGPYCSATLADMGAEVIKIESIQRLDVHRRQGPYPEKQPGHNRSGVWNAQNRGKRSVTFNLSTPGGRDLARRLVAVSDVVVENFSPGVMQRLGLDYESLRAVNPRIVMVSLSAFGQTGPQSAYVGYGPSLDAWSGLTALTGYPGGAPLALGGIFPDTGSALQAAFAIQAALHRRDRTGEGCYIDFSELEAAILLIGDLVVGQLSGDMTSQALGNADPHYAPQGAWPTRGEDRWLALSVPDQRAWQGLCALLGREEWAADPALASAAGRQERHAEIAAAIAAWAAQQEALSAMHALQAAGVPAAVNQDVPGLLADPQLRDRGFFQELPHPEVGETLVYGAIWRLSDTPGGTGTAAPVLGQDNDFVLQDVLGLDPAEIQRLVAEQIVY